MDQPIVLHVLYEECAVDSWSPAPQDDINTLLRRRLGVRCLEYIETHGPHTVRLVPAAQHRGPSTLHSLHAILVPMETAHVPAGRVVWEHAYIEAPSVVIRDAPDITAQSFSHCCTYAPAARCTCGRYLMEWEGVHYGRGD